MYVIIGEPIAGSVMESADVSGIVSHILEVFRHRLYIGSDRRAEFVPVVPVGHEARLYHAARRTAQRRRGKGMGKPHGFLCEPVDIRCFDLRIPVGSRIRPAMIVGNKENNIGSVGSCCRTGCPGYASQEGAAADQGRNL